VAAVQLTFTHKQYTEYRERDIHNKKLTNLRSADRCELYPGICLTAEEQARKTLSSVAARTSQADPVRYRNSEQY
jgi:hypothetical protein